MIPTANLHPLLLALQRHDVHCVIVGGVAVAAHGYERTARDLDLVPQSDSDNLDRLAQALHELGATLPSGSSGPISRTRERVILKGFRILTVDTRFGALDVIQSAAGVPAFEALDRDAVDTELLGMAVRVCSLAHLRQMKQAVDRVQDRADLENLPEPEPEPEPEPQP